MDLDSLNYFLEASKDLHFTKTAERLYISQQTLSNHIKRLETELGVLLFERRPKISLTFAGEYLHSFAEDMMKKQVNLRDMIQDIQNQESGFIRFGVSIARADTFLPKVLPDFIRRYPKVEVRVTNGIATRLEEMLASGELDLVVALAGEPKNSLIAKILLDDPVYLCVSDRLLKEHCEDAELFKEKALNGVEAKDISALPLCMYSNRLGDQLFKCFEETGVMISPVLTATYTRPCLSLCDQGLSASFSTQSNLANQICDLSEDINIFPFHYRGEPLTQRLVLLRNRERYLSSYLKFFMELIFIFFENLERLNLIRKI